MGNRKSLGRLISRYAAYELVYSFFIILFFYGLLNLMISKGFLLPANYAENHVTQTIADFESRTWSTEEIPYFYDYQYSKDGQLVETTIDHKDEELVDQAIAHGSSISTGVIGMRVFKHVSYEDKELVLSYRLTLIPTSKNVYKLVGNFEFFYLVFILGTWSIGFIALLRRLTRLIKLEMNKISSTNSHLQKMELDYPREMTKYTEIYDVLQSLDVLARDLKASLQEQWHMQEDQKKLIETVTHDIRTPITLIKGNLDLLKEESPTIDEERIEDIEKGISRLEIYIQKLRNYSMLAIPHKVPVGEESLDYWVDLMATICKSNNRQFKVLQKDESKIFLDKESIAIALQNITVNAIEHSEVDTSIFAAFIDEEDSYSIVLKDQGSGFDDNILSKATNKNISSKTLSDTIHGLGLHIVQDIVESHNGKLLIKNYEDKSSSGAEVKMVFMKSN
ncbi:sensor histidine kinase [Granulicatella seriolae]|uniref:histidine kinase n=1 Tax=Granulicatella seriolae TaxID=2967226 RepID=A0ABT1WNT4_9LACT|nr:HAMP domain-containing sensor histidine kinase [Granulicatella seriolae]